jgi:glutamate---cysteine ligase / carboxylate-amine ligase
MRKIGVEEELMLVDPATGELAAVSSKALRAHEEMARQDEDVEDDLVDQEAFLQQIETATKPCTGLAELREEIVRGRRAAGRAARAAGAAAVAVPTPVLTAEEAQVTPKERHQRILDEYGEMSRQSLVCGMHMHIDIESHDEAVRVLDGIRPWLQVLIAISANSPYWYGRDTGFASWRSQVWGRWPSAGPAEPFNNPEEYRRTLEKMVEWGAAADEGMLYLDTRVAKDLPTIEVRVADVCTEVEDAVLIASLARALVETAATESDSRAWRSDLLRAASWRASRYGLAGTLVNPHTWQLAPAREVFEALRTHVEPALHDAGDWEWTGDAFDRLMAQGTGSARQRSAYEASGSVAGVVEDLIARTEDSWLEAEPVAS